MRPHITFRPLSQHCLRSSDLHRTLRLRNGAVLALASERREQAMNLVVDFVVTADGLRDLGAE